MHNKLAALTPTDAGPPTAALPHALWARPPVLRAARTAEATPAGLVGPAFWVARPVRTVRRLTGPLRPMARLARPTWTMARVARPMARVMRALRAIALRPVGPMRRLMRPVRPIKPLGAARTRLEGPIAMRVLRLVRVARVALRLARAVLRVTGPMGFVRPVGLGPLRAM